MFTDIELLLQGLKRNCYTIFESGKITHDSSIYRTQDTPREVLFGVGSVPSQNCWCAKVLVGCLQTWDFYFKGWKAIVLPCLSLEGLLMT